MRYVLNHFYKLKHDKYRSLIYSSNANEVAVVVDKNWMDFVHPIYAMILSFFSRPIAIKMAVKDIANFLSTKESIVCSLIDKMINSRGYFHIPYKGHDSNFPPNILIQEKELKSEVVDYRPEMFLYKDVDLNTFRLFNSPLDITFMVNNKCLTNCIYCYANKNYKCKSLDFSKVESIIDEADNLGIRNFSVDGGEFFIYPYWKELLQVLKYHKFVPYLVSTKYLISEDDIVYFSRFNIPLQISLDSYNSKVLDKMVGKIPLYAEKMVETLQCLDKHYPFQIATILTCYNGTIENMEDMLSHIRQYKNIKKWDIRVAFKSLYALDDFTKIQLKREAIPAIREWVNRKQQEVPFELTFSSGRELDFYQTKGGSMNFKGNRCSANSTHLFILPDGKVSICEQLYWNERFIIGDLMEQSISDVWKSSKALHLANMQAKDYSKESACKSCLMLSSCNSALNKCFTNILKVYGEEHWDFPDPRCYYAPRGISDAIYV